MVDCQDDNVRRWPPAPPPAGANAPAPRAKPKAQTEGSGEPAQVDPEKGGQSREKKARENPPPGVMGPEAGPTG